MKNYRDIAEKLVDQLITPKPEAAFSFEIALSVADYVDTEATDGDDEIAFQNCEEDTDGALEQARQEFKDVGADLTDCRFDIPRFVEFDSGNWTHAGGIFELTLYGPPDKVLAAAQAHLNAQSGYDAADPKPGDFVDAHDHVDMPDDDPDLAGVVPGSPR
jgi:hypothetical protein